MRGLRVEIVSTGDLETAEFLAIRQSVLEKRKRRRETHYIDCDTREMIWIEADIWAEAEPGIHQGGVA